MSDPSFIRHLIPLDIFYGGSAWVVLIIWLLIVSLTVMSVRILLVIGLLVALV